MAVIELEGSNATLNHEYSIKPFRFLYEVRNDSKNVLK